MIQAQLLQTMQPQQPTMIQKNLQKVLQKISLSSLSSPTPTKPIRLVAVSKTKSVPEILQAYKTGLRHFGQNYVDELEEKSPQLPQDIKWHFIGHLQSNKVKKVMVKGLEYLETVDRESLADKVQKYLEKNQQDRKLKVFIQVKTSQQQSKNGAEESQVQHLYQFIKQKCPNLQFRGLMTIGKQGDLQAFKKLYEMKVRMLEKYQIKEEEFQLSMGMSGDYEKAIEYGATSVRIGSLIFGARNYPKKQEKQIKQEKQEKKSQEKTKNRSPNKQ